MGRRSQKGSLMCTKRRIRTENEAKAELVGAAIARNRGNKKRKEIRYYFCSVCKAFHLTSRPWRLEDQAAG